MLNNDDGRLVPVEALVMGSEGVYARGKFTGVHSVAKLSPTLCDQ